MQRPQRPSVCSLDLEHRAAFGLHWDCRVPSLVNLGFGTDRRCSLPQIPRMLSAPSTSSEVFGPAALQHLEACQKTADCQAPPGRLFYKTPGQYSSLRSPALCYQREIDPSLSPCVPSPLSNLVQ